MNQKANRTSRTDPKKNNTGTPPEGELRRVGLFALEGFVVIVLLWGFWRTAATGREATPELYGALVLWLGCVIAVSFRLGRIWRSLNRSYVAITVFGGGLILGAVATEVLAGLILDTWLTGALGVAQK